VLGGALCSGCESLLNLAVSRRAQAKDPGCLAASWRSVPLRNLLKPSPPHLYTNYPIGKTCTVYFFIADAKC